MYLPSGMESLSYKDIGTQKTQIQTHTNFNIFVGRLIEIVFFILIVVFILDLWWFTNHHRATYNLPGQVKFTCLECGRAREWVVADR